MPVNEYELTICGAGPAGISPLIYLDDKNELDSMLDKGVCIIDASAKIGYGNIGDYSITANSLGDVFFEVFKNTEGELYNYIIKQASYMNIRPYLTEAPPLPLVGEVLADMGRYISHKVQTNKNSSLNMLSEVKKIKRRKDGKFEVTFTPRLPHMASVKIISKNILFNIGGEQIIPASLKEKSRDYWKSSDFLTRRYDKELLDSVTEKSLTITILGGSHSAFSCLYRLKNEFNVFNNPKVQINILHRNPIKLFYNSELEAREDSYPFDSEKDVCNLSGRVNRYSGLRYDSFSLANDVLKGEFTNINLLSEKTITSPSKEELLDQSEIIMVCTGYRNSSIEILDENDRKFDFKTYNGTLETDAEYNPILLNDRTLTNFYTYGLGSGPKTSLSNGGELNFNGRIDGIWVYQNEVAPKILEKMNSRQFEKEEV